MDEKNKEKENSNNKEKQNQGDEDWIRFYDQLPSDDYRDYVTITVSGILKNRSFFNQDGMFGNLEGVKNEDKVIDQYPVVSLHYVNRMEEKDMNLIYFDIYCKNMTEKEIVDYVNGLSLNLYFGSKIRRNNVLKLDLKDAQWSLPEKHILHCFYE